MWTARMNLNLCALRRVQWAHCPRLQTSAPVVLVLWCVDPLPCCVSCWRALREPSVRFTRSSPTSVVHHISTKPSSTDSLSPHCCLSISVSHGLCWKHNPLPPPPSRKVLSGWQRLLVAATRVLLPGLWKMDSAQAASGHHPKWMRSTGG